VRGAGRVQPLDARAKAGGLGGRHRDRHPVGQGNRLRVRGPVRGGHQHLVTGVEQRLERVVDGLLAAVGDQHLRWVALEARVAPGLVGDRAPQYRQPRDRGVVVVRRVRTRGDRGLHDPCRSGEVGLAGAETDDVLTGGEQRLRLGIDGEGRGLRDRADPPGDPRMLSGERARALRSPGHALILPRRPDWGSMV
jgi:hypothetical protein